MDWESFTPLSSLLGGFLIGFGAFSLFSLRGKIMGVSGIISGIIENTSTKTWRILFLVGTVLGPFLLVQFSLIKIEAVYFSSGATNLIASFLVGLGTAIGSGCTSGHGVCGLARFSLRSLVAVCVFVSTGIITVFCVQKLGYFP